jgi:phosphotransferase system enzyme I (PtsI)
MSKVYKGIGASDGIAVANAYVLVQPTFNINQHKVSDVNKELNLYHKAITQTIEQIQSIRTIVQERMGEGKAEIFDAHMQIANDPEIISEVNNLIKSTTINAAFAIEKAYEKYREMFTSMADAYFKERAADIVDVKKRVLANVLGVELPNVIDIKKESIIITHDLSPSETALLNPKFVKGFITAVGGRTSHAAIMARTMEIPAVLGVNDIINQVKQNDVIAINGMIGEVEVNPKNESL